jgi:hypothetical protein
MVLHVLIPHILQSEDLLDICTCLYVAKKIDGTEQKRQRYPVHVRVETEGYRSWSKGIIQSS